MRIEARGLCKRFGRVLALRDVSFDVPSGGRVALIGPNGSGKSTLNRVLMGLLRFEGEVRVDGRSPLAERVAIARRMAYVPQIAPQLGAPVGEVVRALTRLRSLDRGGVPKLAAELDVDLPAIARRPFRSLSGGTKQKLMIALALAAQPALLILDEPTGSLDARSRERFFALFDALSPETTVLLCSHRLEEVRQLVGQVLLLEDGRLIYSGAASQFLEASTTSLLEVCAAGESAARWLRERGFRPGRSGWWVRTLSHAEKVRLLPELCAALGSSLRDLNVRDLESLELGSGNER